MLVHGIGTESIDDGYLKQLLLVRPLVADHDMSSSLSSIWSSPRSYSPSIHGPVWKTSITIKLPSKPHVVLVEVTICVVKIRDTKYLDM